MDFAFDDKKTGVGLLLSHCRVLLSTGIYTESEERLFDFTLSSFPLLHITKNRSRICHSVEFILTVYTHSVHVCLWINLSLLLSLEVIEWKSLTLLFTR